MVLRLNGKPIYQYNKRIESLMERLRLIKPIHLEDVYSYSGLVVKDYIIKAFGTPNYFSVYIFKKNSNYQTFLSVLEFKRKSWSHLPKYVQKILERLYNKIIVQKTDLSKGLGRFTKPSKIPKLNDYKIVCKRMDDIVSITTCLRCEHRHTCLKSLTNVFYSLDF